MSIHQLQWHDQNPHAMALQQHASGSAVIGWTSGTVPRELLRAAGAFPVLLRPEASNNGAGSELADQILEDVFDRRTRALFEFLTSPASAFLDLVVIPRSSEQEHKLFLYLREVVRQHKARTPELYLLNVPQDSAPEAEAFCRDEFTRLQTFLHAHYSTAITDQAIAQQIEIETQARAMALHLQALRSGPSSSITGSTWMELLCARYALDPESFVSHAKAATLGGLGRQAASSRPTVAIIGCLSHGTKLHSAIDRCGGFVLQEECWWGSAGLATELNPPKGLDPLAQLALQYRAQPTPRLIRDSWFRTAARQCDVVISYLPPEDDVWGWEYPRRRAWLEQEGIPHLLIREDAEKGFSAETMDRLCALLQQAETRNQSA
jgi:benzoyl-CoA reductase/2-hydroxyglutaryl-CoA dehydratase subunit BcrC/BadD/HgdB